MKSFDKKFGKTFAAQLPATPGVYSVYNSDGVLIYIGKARNLKRRLSQYRNAKRCKKHRKMRVIIQEADRIEYQNCETDLDACLVETRLIQEHRPKWNVAGAFYFLYPMIGIKLDTGRLNFCYTTTPETFEGYDFHGAYRSRHITGEAFFALMKLLTFVGHRATRDRSKIAKYSYVFSYRQIPESWHALWASFLRGDSKVAMETLVFSLLENAGARKDPKEIQDHINALIRFWKYEAKPLAKARVTAAFEIYPVPQRERDILFLKRRYAAEARS